MTTVQELLAEAAQAAQNAVTTLAPEGKDIAGEIVKANWREASTGNRGFRIGAKILEGAGAGQVVWGNWWAGQPGEGEKLLKFFRDVKSLGVPQEVLNATEELEQLGTLLVGKTVALTVKHETNRNTEALEAVAQWINPPSARIKKAFPTGGVASNDGLPVIGGGAAAPAATAPAQVAPAAQVAAVPAAGGPGLPPGVV